MISKNCFVLVEYIVRVEHTMLYIFLGQRYFVAAGNPDILCYALSASTQEVMAKSVSRPLPFPHLRVSNALVLEESVSVRMFAALRFLVWQTSDSELPSLADLRLWAAILDRPPSLSCQGGRNTRSSLPVSTARRRKWSTPLGSSIFRMFWFCAPLISWTETIWLSK